MSTRIPQDVIVTLLYALGKRVNNLLVYDVPIKILLNSDGSLRTPIGLDVVATLNTGVKVVLELGINYSAKPILNGLEITLLADIENCVLITFTRNTTVNYNNLYVNTNDVKSKLDADFTEIYAGVQDVKSQFTTFSSDLTVVNNSLTTKAEQTYVDASFIPKTEKAVPNGLATLDSQGIVPQSQLPKGATEFLGLYDAQTNTPTLTNGSGTLGDYYLVKIGGSNFITASTGDTVYRGQFDWEVVPNYIPVISVNSKIGIVTLTKNDIGLGSADNTSDADKPLSTASAQALAGKLNLLPSTLIPNNILVNDLSGQATNSGFTIAQTLSTSTTALPTSNAVSVAIASANISVNRVEGLQTFIANNTDNKADKFIPAIPRNLARLDAFGNIEDSNVQVASDTGLTANSSLLIPTQNSVKEYVDAKDALTEKISNKGQANGYCPVGADGKVPAEYLNTGISNKGLYNAQANIPVLTTGSGVLGDYYIVKTGGSNFVTAGIGDTVIRGNTDWEVIPTSSVAGVTSFYGLTGAIEPTLDVILDGSTRKLYTPANFTADFNTKTTDNLSEGSRRYFTEEGVRETPMSGYAISTAPTTSSDRLIEAMGKKADNEKLIQLNEKMLTDFAPLESPVFTGTPRAPTIDVLPSDTETEFIDDYQTRVATLGSIFRYALEEKFLREVVIFKARINGSSLMEIRSVILDDTPAYRKKIALSTTFGNGNFSLRKGYLYKIEVQTYFSSAVTPVALNYKLHYGILANLVTPEKGTYTSIQQWLYRPQPSQVACYITGTPLGGTAPATQDAIVTIENLTCNKTPAQAPQQLDPWNAF